MTKRILSARTFSPKCVTLLSHGHGYGESGDVVSEDRRDVAIGIRDAVRGGMRSGCGTAFVSTLVFLSAGLSACAESRPSPPRTVTVARVPRDGEPRAIGAPTMLVWARDKQGLAWTYQVQPDGKADGRLEGIHIATTRGRWSWVTKTLDVETEPCDLSLGSRHPAQGGTVTRASVVGSGDREQLIVDPETGCGGEHCPNEVRHEARPVASLGPYLFVEQSTYAYACGAHGFTHASFVVWDLDKARKVDLVGQVPNREALFAEAARQMIDDATDRLGIFGDGKADITEILPVVEGSSKVAFQAQLTVPTCYACGDGLWSSYTRSVRVKAPAPAPLASFTELPTQVSIFLAHHTGLSLGGWSERRDGETGAE